MFPINPNAVVFYMHCSQAIQQGQVNLLDSGMLLGLPQVPLTTNENSIDTSHRRNTQRDKTLTNNDQKYVRFPASLGANTDSNIFTLNSFAPVRNLLHQEHFLSQTQGN